MEWSKSAYEDEHAEEIVKVAFDCDVPIVFIFSAFVIKGAARLYFYIFLFLKIFLNFFCRHYLADCINHLQKYL